MTKEIISYKNMGSELFSIVNEPGRLMPNGLFKTMAPSSVNIDRSKLANGDILKDDSDEIRKNIAFHYTNKEAWPKIF